MKDGSLRRTVIPMILRHVFRYELTLLLEKGGLRLQALYGDYDLSRYGEGGPRMIAVAQVDGRQ